MAIGGTTRVFGVMGWPVEHSRSPQMHAAAIGATGVDAVYVPFGVPPDRLADAVRGAVALGIGGFNVTLPHKEAIVALLDEVDAHARAIGAVNTVVRRQDTLVGLNTDAPGLVRSLEEAGVAVQGRKVTVLGAGGAARASVVGLVDAGAEMIAVAARRPERARALLEALRPTVDCGDARATGLADGLGDALARSDLLVQATSATLRDRPHAASFAEALPLDRLASSAAVVDLVYEPRQTTVLEAAAKRGLRTVDGLGMLVHQGALAFEHWTGEAAPVEAMRRALAPGG